MTKTLEDHTIAYPRLTELLSMVQQRSQTFAREHTPENRDRVVEAKTEVCQYVDEQVLFYRDKLRHLAALCGMASSYLCLPVSEKNISDAKECVVVGIDVMRILVEEDKATAVRRALVKVGS